MGFSKNENFTFTSFVNIFLDRVIYWKALETIELIIIYLHIHLNDKDWEILNINSVWWTFVLLTFCQWNKEYVSDWILKHCTTRRVACATLGTLCQWNKGTRLLLAKAQLMSLDLRYGFCINTGAQPWALSLAPHSPSQVLLPKQPQNLNPGVSLYKRSAGV